MRIILCAIPFIVGCASIGDVNEIQGQIDGIRVDIEVLEHDVADIRAMSDESLRHSEIAIRESDVVRAIMIDIRRRLK